MPRERVRFTSVSPFENRRPKPKPSMRETLSMSNILCNVFYSFMLCLTGCMSAIGLATYQWIEADVADIETFATVPISVPGLNKVSCGLVHFCVDAAGAVAECQLPWPVYNDDLTAQPSRYWTATAIVLCLAITLLGFSWLYSLVACFGLFKQKWQKISVRVVDCAGVLMLLALLIWGASFSDYAVNKCDHSVTNDDECTSWTLVFPSHIIEGGKNNTGCRICGPNMAMFQLSSTCKLGWGAIFVVVSVVLSLLSSCVGRRVHGRHYSGKVGALERELAEFG
eukprot:m.89918 g.89918  ORF g.89918 m.89918 type:complete len:282 (-) comp26344_c0_seq2:78-923(-)